MTQIQSSSLSSFRERELARIKELAGNRTVFSSAFLREMPECITPFSLFFHNRAFGDDGGITRIFAHTLAIGAPPDRTTIHSLCGRSYTDIKAFEKLISFPGLPFYNNLSERQRKSDEPMPYECISNISLSLPSLMLVPFWPLYMYRTLQICFTLFEVAVQFHHQYHHNVLPRYHHYLDKLKAIDTAHLSTKEMLELLNNAVEHAACKTRKHWELGRILSIATYELLACFTRWEFEDNDGTLASGLVAGTANPFLSMESELWKLGDMLRGNPELIALIKKSWDLSLLKSSEGNAFKEAFQHFIDKYGHCAEVNLELAVPRWSDDIGRTLAIIVDRAENRTPNPEKIRILDEERARKLAKEALNAMQCSIRKEIFLHLLGAARRYSPYSELPLFYYLKECAQVRRLAIALGEKLKESNKFGRDDDIFFILWSELPLYVYDGLPVKKIQYLVDRRRNEWENAQSCALPSVILSEQLYPILRRAAKRAE
ncbi:MAG: hypothetical protein AB2L14_18920 [Candidatus Xenobiia bacterium LiM19]